MALAAVTISFQEDLLTKIDSFAENEERTRSDLVAEAARIYINKKELERIFAYGKSLSKKYKFTEDDVHKEIKKYRKG